MLFPGRRVTDKSRTIYGAIIGATIFMLTWNYTLLADETFARRGRA